jgi:hypothetical protein
MVSVAQLVEPRVVIPVVVGSSPIVHPIYNENLRFITKDHLSLYKTELLIDNPTLIAKVAELVDALDLGSSGATCESSSLSFRTIYYRI